MEPRRRSARLKALQGATENEEASLDITKALTSRKRNVAKNVIDPPKNKRRQSSKVEVDENVDNKLELSQIQKLSDIPEPENEVSKKPMDEGKKLVCIEAVEQNSMTELPETPENKELELVKHVSNETEVKLDLSRQSSSSSLETFNNESEPEEVSPQKPPTLGRFRSRNLPVRSRKVICYTEKKQKNVDSSESDLSDNESSSSSEEKKDNKTKGEKRGTIRRNKRKYEPSTEETSSEDDDDEEEEEDKDGNDSEDEAPKKKISRGRSTTNGGRKKTSSARVTARRPSSGLKTPINKVTKPWEKQTGHVMKHKQGDIIVPPRRLRRGEEKMLVFRILANQLALERNKEIDIDEGYRLLGKIKDEYNEDKEGYIRRVLMTDGRDVDKPVEEIKKTEEQKEEENSSSSEDEWMEMELVDADQKKLEVTVEDKEASGYDWWAIYLRQEVNKKIREKYENCHKVHLLCYMAHLHYLVKVILHEKTVPYLLLTQLPEKLMALQGETINLDMAQRIAIWFKSNFNPSSASIFVGQTKDYIYEETARFAILAGEKSFETDMERASLLFAIFDALGATSRICVNTRPISRRWDDESLTKTNKKPPKETKHKKGNIKKNEEIDYWVEYWDIAEKRWICIDPATGNVDKPFEIEAASHSPIHYIFAIDNKKGIRDVSARYASDFCRPEFRRRRTEGSWLTRTLNREIVQADQHRAKLEDVHFRTEMTIRPLPTTLMEYKNHPLYVLEKDLLKYQALYPPPSEQKPLGDIRGHKVYPRSSVHTLLGEKKWEKLARSIKEDERPYKVVKATSDPRIPKEERIQGYLNVYGYWQTEPFRPLKVENGVIPCNEFGNVYLYQPIMCPIGAVHLRLPGLPQIGRKLNKPCVPAITGWDFNHCGNYPVVDGACVLEGDKEVFIKAWRKQEAEREEREKKKRTERSLKNWKKFIQGVLRLHRVKMRFGHPVEEEKNKKKSKTKKEVKKEALSETVAKIIDNTAQPIVKEYTLHDVMGI